MGGWTWELGKSGVWQQLPEYRAFQIFQSMAGLGSLANLEFGNWEYDPIQILKTNIG